MKNKEFKIRISSRRLYKLRLYAAHTDKTMTGVIEYHYDSLPTPEISNDSSTIILETYGLPLELGVIIIARDFIPHSLEYKVRCGASDRFS